MGLYIRKYVTVGHLRFNLSKSAVGLSSGLRGFRLGSGPRGNYVHMGRHGVYFRKSLKAKDPASTQTRSPIQPQQPESLGPSVGVEMQEIESGSTLEMVDASSRDILDEINHKAKLSQLFPFGLALGVIVVVVSLAMALPMWAIALTIIFALAVSIVAKSRDQLARTTVLLYDLEPDVADAYEALHNALTGIQDSSSVWHIAAQGDTRDRKYHAGASTLVERSPIRLRKGQLARIKTNVEIPLVPAGRQQLAFFPDRLLVLDLDRAGAVPYDELNIKIDETRFVESGSVPPDAEIVDHTWKYVNKKGGPDRRFKDNRQLPIALYEDIHLISRTGLNELFEVSRLGLGEPLKRAIAGMAALSQPKTQRQS